jgi:hypothetical protein
MPLLPPSHQLCHGFVPQIRVVVFALIDVFSTPSQSSAIRALLVSFLLEESQGKAKALTSQHPDTHTQILLVCASSRKDQRIN